MSIAAKGRRTRMGGKMMKNAYASLAPQTIVSGIIIYVVALCGRIIKSQREEIDQMKEILARI